MEIVPENEIKKVNSALVEGKAVVVTRNILEEERWRSKLGSS